MFKLVRHSVCTLAAVLVVNETMALVFKSKTAFLMHRTGTDKYLLLPKCHAG